MSFLFKRSSTASVKEGATPLTLFDALEVSKASPALDYRKDIVLKDKIAEGGAAVIHLATIKTAKMRNRLNMGENEQVVVKILKEPPNVEKDKIKPAFQQEVALMWLLGQQRHFIRLLGYCNEPMTFVTKHYEFGSLSDAIHQKSNVIPEDKWDSEFLYRVSSDIAQAIFEMHNRGIIHNDIKPANMLLEKDEYGHFMAVLCDFGIASIVSNPVLGIMTFGMSKARGASAAYAAPEVFTRLRTGKGPEHPDLKKAADIYAFGISTHEFINRQQPWNNTLKKSTDIEKAVLDGLRPQLSDEIKAKKENDKTLAFLCSTMELCWLQNAAARPTAESLSKTFQAFNPYRPIA